MLATAATTPALVHYLPIGTTTLSAAFIIILLARAKKRAWAPHLVWWAIGVFFYGLGTAFESTITLTGNTPLLNTLWYWAGAILGGYPLATGSVYLLFPRKVANVMTALSLAFVIFASVAVFMAPVDLSKLEGHRPGGAAIEWQWVRLLTPFINLYALIFLVGGAAQSSWKFFLAGDQPKRAAGTALIAVGALLPGFGGAATKAGHVELLYIGEFVGIIMIWIGYELCVRAPAPRLDTVGASTANEPATADPS